MLGPSIVISGPLAVALWASSFAGAFSTVLAVFIGSLAVYVITLQYLQKYARLGVPNVIIISLAPSMFTVEFYLASGIDSALLILSGILVVFGASMFVASQVAKNFRPSLR